MPKQQRKIVISAAITGGVHTPSMSPYLPKTAEEIIENAGDAGKAGAAIVHIHARMETASPPPTTTRLKNTDRHQKALQRRHRHPHRRRAGHDGGGALRGHPAFSPEIASANGGSINFCFSRLAENAQFEYDWERPFIEGTYDNVFKNTFKDIEYCINMMNSCDTLPEYELFDYGQIANLGYFVKKGIVRKPIYLQFVPGIMGGMPISNEGMMFIIDQAKKTLGEDIQYCCVAPGRRMFRLATLMALNGGNVRVGMEDGLYLKPGGELARNNAAQVQKIRGILEALDYEIASPDEAREQLHLKGLDKVNF
jgi:uncharacterized protein (DUF849 family)